VKIVQLADIHFGVEDADALREVERLIAGSEPDALIVCGDLTQRGKRREFAAAREWLDQFDRPILVVPGNHDTPLLNIVQRVTGPFDRFDDYFAEFTRPIDIGAWRFTGLNTARGWQARGNWAEGSVDLETLAGLARRGPRTAIVCHHPFVSPPETPLRTRTRRGRDADEMLKKANAGLLLSGHVHVPTAERRGPPGQGYLAITAGTLSRRLRDRPPSCNMLTFEADAISLTALSFSAGTTDARHVGRFDAPSGTQARDLR